MAIQRKLILLTACAALVLAHAVVAFAHAHLVRAVPAAGGTVQAAPSEVTLHFSEKLEAAFSSVLVRNSAGKRVDKADGRVDKTDRTVMRVSLQPLTPGIYKVEWRVVTADTHKINGDFTFRVGP
jgi:methionine-rich copper-binding protein CopC